MIKENIVHHIELASDINSISEIEVFVDNFCENHSIGEDSYGNILIALTEAVNNAIMHGNKLDPSKKVTLGLETHTNELHFVIKDEGEGFDFDNIPDPTLPENISKLNGRGVFLMKSLADEILFEENGTKILLKFSLLAN